MNNSSDEISEGAVGNGATSEPSAFDALMAEFTHRAGAAGLTPNAAPAPVAPVSAFPVAVPPAPQQPASAAVPGRIAVPSYAPLPYAPPPPMAVPIAPPAAPPVAEPATEHLEAELSGLEQLGLVEPEPSPAAFPPPAFGQAVAYEPPVLTSPSGMNLATARGTAPTQVLPVITPPPAIPTIQSQQRSRAVALEPDDLDSSTLTTAERQALELADPDLIAHLQQVVLQRASDLHITVNAPPTLRIDGGLRPSLDDKPWSRTKVTSALMSLLNDRQIQKFEEALELDFAFTISANARFRVNFYQQRGAIGAAFRLIPTEIKQLKELGVPDVVAQFAGLPRGLVLVTGPTGSGKSTTLAALIDLVNETRADHIVTVEDPIEFMHTHKKALVNQREVGADTHSFTAALKHVLRQDPDVILVGELRDLETISVALTAAETGHLVFATLHTQSAAQTIDRIIDVFPPHQQEQVRSQLALTLQGVVCQTLVKRANGKGRAVATEILITTPAVSNLIREGQTHQITAAMQAGGQFGMRTLDQHLAELVNSGVVTRAAAKDKAHDLESLEHLITRTDTSRPTNALSAGINYRDAYTESQG